MDKPYERVPDFQIGCRRPWHARSADAGQHVFECHGMKIRFHALTFFIYGVYLEAAAIDLDAANFPALIRQLFPEPILRLPATLRTRIACRKPGSRGFVGKCKAHNNQSHLQDTFHGNLSKGPKDCDVDFKAGWKLQQVTTW